MGRSVRKFQKDTSKLDTRPLPRDDRERGVKKRRKTGKEKKRVLLNLHTFKWHNMPHLGEDAPEVGPADIYDTRGVSALCLWGVQ